MQDIKTKELYGLCEIDIPLNGNIKEFLTVASFESVIWDAIYFKNDVITDLNDINNNIGYLKRW